jgi:hypothetical protein
MTAEKKIAFLQILSILFVSSIASVFFIGCDNPQKLNLNTEYQVVILDNGNAYFGKLEFSGKSFVLLKDVFYIQTQINQANNTQTNVLIKRGKELHAPDMMYVNTKHIILIEPVGPESQVAKLIKEAKAQKN